MIRKGFVTFLKPRLPTAPDATDGQNVVVLRDTGGTGVVARETSHVSQDLLIGKMPTVTLRDETMQMNPLAAINVHCPF